MLRRPQRTEARLRAGGEDGAYLCGSLEGGGELNQWPRAQPSGSRLGLKREHGAYRCRVQPQHGESATQRHGACGAAMHAACARPRCCLSALPPQGDGGGGSCPARSEAEATSWLLGKRGRAGACRRQPLGAEARGRGVPFSPAPGDNSLRSVLNSQHQQQLSDLLTAAASGGGGLPCSNRSNRTKGRKIS